MKPEHILLTNPKGWRSSDFTIQVKSAPALTGDPKKNSLDLKTKKQLKKAFLLTKEKRPNDFNGSKLSVQKIEPTTKGVKIITRKTDYFTIWGLPQGAPKLFEQSNKDFINSNESSLPAALYSACFVITKDNKALMGVSSPGHGFGSGRLSFGFEEQAEVYDKTPVDTAKRGLKEEFGINSLKKDIVVLGLGKSLTIAYLSVYCVIFVNKTAKEASGYREKAQDQDEHSGMLAVPLNKVSTMLRDEIPARIAQKYLVSGKLDTNTSLIQHIANQPRWKLTKKYLRVIKS